MAKANDTPYGLSAGIWTEKGSKILWMADRLDAGVVWANTYNQFDPTGAPTDLDPAVIGEAADNVKRVVRGDADEQSPYSIADFCEMKTVWHPVGR